MDNGSRITVMPIRQTSEARPLEASVSPQAKIEQSLNLPNILTFSRILLVPVYIVLFYDPTPTRAIAAAGVFGVAALTDLLDGYLARRRAQITTIGRLLDPIADKLLVLAGLVLLVQFHRIEAWIAIAMIAREIGVTGIRAIGAAEGIIVQAGTLGKYKVVLQIIAIILLTLEGAVFLPFVSLSALGMVALYLALGFSIISGIQYAVDIWKAFLRTGLLTKKEG